MTENWEPIMSSTMTPNYSLLLIYLKRSCKTFNHFSNFNVKNLKFRLHFKALDSAAETLWLVIIYGSRLILVAMVGYCLFILNAKGIIPILICTFILNKPSRKIEFKAFCLKQPGKNCDYHVPNEIIYGRQ